MHAGRRIAAASARLGIATALLAAHALFAAEDESPIADLESVIGKPVTAERPSRRPAASGSLKMTAARGQSGSFNLRRRVDTESLSFSSVRAHGERGGRLDATIVRPSGVKKAPGVFLLDPENARTPDRIPEDMSWAEATGMSLLAAPFGVHFAAGGYAVAFPSGDALNNLTAFTLDDWAELFVKFQKHPAIDRESCYLVATREYAELAFRLAGQLSLAGLIVEEPHHMMFREEGDAKNPLAGGMPFLLPPVLDGSPPEIARFTPSSARWYLDTAENLKSPLLLVVAKESPYAAFNRQTLLQALQGVNADFRVVLLDEPARSAVPPSKPSKAEKPAEIIRYEEVGMERWITRMLQFCHDRSRTKPEPLPEPRSRQERRRDPFGQKLGPRSTEGEGSGD